MSDSNDFASAIVKLRKRVEEMDDRLPPDNVLEFLRKLTPCSDCGVVFVDQDAHGEHVCAGRQGR